MATSAPSRTPVVPPSLESERAARGALRRRFPVLAEPLPDEDVMVASWGGRTEPIVTVRCPVFDQVGLVEDALHGVLMQRTTFPFRVVVHDDGSTDGTRDVIRRIAAHYPRLVRLDLRPLDVGDRPRPPRRPGGRTSTSRLHRLAMVEGEFVAVCEGDDVWIDPDKLQWQVDDLRAHPSATMSVAGALRIDLVAGTEAPLGLLDSPATYRGRLGAYHHTSTFVMRSDAYATMVREFQIPKRIGGDFATLTYMARRGEIRVLPEVVSVYWSNGRGIWSSLSRFEQLRRQFRNHRRVTIALGPPWPWDEIRYLLRKEAQLSRVAVTEGAYGAAAARVPVVIMDELFRMLLRAVAVLRGAIRRSVRIVGGRRP